MNSFIGSSGRTNIGNSLAPGSSATGVMPATSHSTLLIMGIIGVGTITVVEHT